MRRNGQLISSSRCLNCQKNAVVCEGYPPKEIWKSGKQKMEDGKALVSPCDVADGHLTDPLLVKCSGTD